MLVVLGLIIAFVIVAIYARKNKVTRACRWRQDSSGDRGSLRKYRCAACGAEAFTASDGPPQDCKATLRQPGA